MNTAMSAAFEKAIAAADVAKAFEYLFREFYSAALNSLRASDKKPRAAVEGFLIDLRRKDLALKFLRAVDADRTQRISVELNDGDGGQPTRASDGHNALAASPSLNGDGKGHSSIDREVQTSRARPSPPSGDDVGQASSVGNDHNQLAPSSPSKPTAGAGHTRRASDGQTATARPAVAKPTSSPGHTKRGATVIAMKNKEIKETVLDTHMLAGKKLGGWKLRELPAISTQSFEDGELAMAIYQRNHNKDQSLTVKEVEEDAKAVEALIAACHKEAFRTFRRSHNLLAAG